MPPTLSTLETLAVNQGRKSSSSELPLGQRNAAQGQLQVSRCLRQACWPISYVLSCTSLKQLIRKVVVEMTPAQRINLMTVLLELTEAILPSSNPTGYRDFAEDIGQVSLLGPSSLSLPL